MVTPREIIDDIRRNRYGIGLQTDSQSEKVIEDLKNSLNSALEQLSRDLYSKETHFVLELIQNADDNCYEDSVTPSLKFAIDYEKVLVQNNEKGFTEGNVRALCDIGKTTKRKAQGYIGEKGIGFKSVFRVSNEPQIFSNGFHFKFKGKDEHDKLGYVVPYWIDEPPDYISKKLTNIVLPLREEVKEELSRFKKIEPTLLLFLNKLKVFEIHNITENIVNKVIRQDRNGKVEIKTAYGREYWKLVRHTLKASETLKEEKRKDVKETELILAFSLKPDGSADTVTEQKVFAYLPTHAYGFKFIIQADFLVPANREDIHKDKSWNKWLRDNIASVFLQAVKEFKQDENLKKTYYNYIPLANEVTDPFFSPVVEQIHNVLRETECILTESGNWRKPADTFSADDDIRNLISNDDLKSFFNKEYISSKVKTEQKILNALRVQAFGLNNLFDCLQNTEWLQKQSDKWFVKLYIYLNNLNKQNLTKQRLQALKELKIIRLENNELASISEKSVFFPLDKKGNYGFEKELRVIKTALIGGKETEREVAEFLKKLGVRSAFPHEIIENHILPIYESEDDITNWRSRDSKTLSGYIRYIKENLKDYGKESDKHLNANKQSGEKKEDPLQRLKTSLFIRTNKTIKDTNHYDHPENIYLPKTYGNKNDLETLFKGAEDIWFVHREYIDEIIKKYRQAKPGDKKSKKDLMLKREAEIKEWREFFVKLGINKGLEVEKTSESYLTWEDKLQLIGSWDYTQEKITDYKLIPLQQILESIDKKKAKLLVILLERQWKELAKYLKLKYEWKFYSWYSASADSTWLHLLKTTAWLPTSIGSLAKPSEVFLNKSEIRKRLGDGVPYLAVEIKNEEFIKALGINSEANAEGVLNYLRRISGQKCKDINIFTKLYDFLNKKYDDNEATIKSAFSENKIIYVPDTIQTFFSTQEVLWKNVSNIFGENRGYLEKQYPKLKSFFVDKLGVSEKPKPKDYADVLIDLSQKEKVDKKDEKIIWKIYEELSYHLNPENNERLISEEDWWDDFVSEPIFWTDKEEFWKNDNDIFVNDSQELYELFKDNTQIAFLKLPENDYPKIQYFIDAVDLSYLSKAARTILATEEKPKIEQSLTDEIQKFVPYILRYLYQLEHDNYKSLKKDGTLAQLKNLRCYSVESLQVKYLLNLQSAFAQQNVLLDDGNLYIQKGQLEDTDHLAVELSKLFGELKGLDNFLVSLFDKKTEDKIENLLKAKGIQELPTGEQEWFRIVESVPIKKEVLKGPEEEERINEGKITDAPHGETAKDRSKISDVQPPKYTSELLEIEKTRWQPECDLEGAEIQYEEFKPQTKEEHKIRVTTGSGAKSRDEGDKVGDTLSPETKKAIGKRGEKEAFKCLKERLSANYREGKVEETEDGFIIRFNRKLIVEAHWLNKIEDKGEGCDIKIIESDNEEYIEVKSTKTDTKEWFDMSQKQWEFAQEKGNKFHIYRVYNAGAKPPKVVKVVDIRNPYKHWQEGCLIAYPTRIQI